MCELCSMSGVSPEFHTTATVSGGLTEVTNAEFSAVSETTDAAADTSTTYSISVGDTFNGALTAGDKDWVAVTLQAGESYTISLSGSGGSALSDTYLRVHDTSGNQVAYDDDGGPGLYSAMTFTADSSGTYYLSAGSYGDYYAGGYALSISDASAPPELPTFTNDQIADQLTNGYWTSTGRAQRSFDVEAGDTITVDITGLNADGQYLASNALDAWSAVTGINFSFVSSGGQISFDDENSGAYCSSTVSGTETLSAFVNVSTSWVESYGARINSYTFQTYIHEIGHALGLGHAGNYNGSATYGVDNHYTNDSWQATIMSYFSQGQNTSIDASYAYIITPMVADIIAIQNLYGTPTNVRAGNTVYGNNSTAGDYLDQYTSIARYVAMTIYDSGGTDTFNFSAYSDDQYINLVSEGISDVIGRSGNLIVARGTVIENAIGGSGDDTIAGNGAANTLTGGSGADTMSGASGADVLVGGAGSDTLSGGSGTDTAVYSGVRSAYSVYRTGSNSPTFVKNLATGEIDTVYSTENFRFSNGTFNSLNVLDGADPNAGTSVGGGTTSGGGSSTSSGGGSKSSGGNTSSGDGTSNGSGASSGGGGTSTGGGSSTGGNGDSVVRGNTGADSLTGGARNERLTGGAGDDTMNGGGGGDTLIGGRGEDTVIGGAGNDTVLGGNGNDRLVGGTGRDMVNGGNGTDKLIGGGGADRLNGGAGRDTMIGGTGDDRFFVDVSGDRVTGGAGRDKVFASADYKLKVGVEDLLLTGKGHIDGTGNGLANVITGNAGKNILVGLGGSDQLIGRGGADRLFGGDGRDTLDGGLGQDSLDGGSGRDTLFGGGGKDALFGGSGADRLNGGSGVDTAYYAGNAGRYDVNKISSGTYKIIDSTGNLGSDTLIGVEKISIGGTVFDIDNLL